MKPVSYNFDESDTLDDHQFKKSLTHLIGNQTVEGNSIEELVNGDVFFPHILKSIENAQKTINFETFIFWEGEIGKWGGFIGEWVG